MNNSNLPQHPCANKCSNFKDEQCNHCLVTQVEKREFEVGVAPDEAYVKTISVEATTCSDFVKGDTVVFVDAFMPNDLMTVHKVQGDGILLDGNRKFALADLLRHATTVELNAKRRLTLSEQALAEVP
jgi:FKBP-type peptidyl-prolyl cis-trans isomerase 2